MTAFTDYLVPETLASIRAKMKGYMVAAGSAVTDWIIGAVSQQILEAVNQANWTEAGEVSALVRGYASLDTSTDPGDIDPYDPTIATLTPAPGFLSQKGEGDYGTPRIGQTFATGQVTLTNGYSGAVTFAVGALTFTSSGPGNPTYRNTNGGPIYSRPGGGTIAANPDGSLTVPAGLDVFLPVQAEVIGTGSNASGGQLSLTTTLAPTGVTATNANSILGSDREAADLYRDKCREAAALTSPNGPADSYRYLATTARDDGTYGKSTTGNPIGVTRVYVSEASSTGIVGVYLANASGGAAVGSTNRGIIDALIRTTPGVIAVPNTITITVSLATDTTIAVTYSVKGKASLVPGGATAGTYTTGGGPPAPVAAVFSAIAANLAAYLASVPIGGNDQSGGAGVIYTKDLETAVVTTMIGNVSIGLYDPSVTTPATSTTAIALGHVGILGSVSGTLVLV